MTDRLSADAARDQGPVRIPSVAWRRPMGAPCPAVGHPRVSSGMIDDGPWAGVEEGWETARGAAAVTYERGFWFRTPEAYDVDGTYRATMYLRPLAIWAIEEALARTPRS